MSYNYAVLLDIAKEVGDSFYILDRQKFEKNITDYRSAFENFCFSAHVAYSFKTNHFHDLCRINHELGGFSEVVSGAELDYALALGIPPNRIIFNGPLKTNEDLRKGVELGVTINIDHLSELNTIVSIVSDHSVEASIGLRLNLSDADNKSRFGIVPNAAEFDACISLLRERPELKLFAIHCHIPHRSLESFERRANFLGKVYQEIKDLEPTHLNFGGGMMSPLPSELATSLKLVSVSYQQYAEVICRTLSAAGIEPDEIELIFEPGTAVVADVMTLVGRIHRVRSLNHSKVAVCNLSRYVAHANNHTTDIFVETVTNRLSHRDDESIDLVGYTCIEGDKLATLSGFVEEGDFIVIPNAGSYSNVMKPPFILPDVPIVSLLPKLEVLRPRQSIQSMFRFDPSFF